MFGRIGMAEMIVLPFLYIPILLIPAIVLYFVVKFAVKNGVKGAVKELKDEGVLQRKEL